ncbi:hypothetical protein ACFO3C_13045 [Halostagnicola sp. GCM10023398]
MIEKDGNESRGSDLPWTDRADDADLVEVDSEPVPYGERRPG